MTTKQQELIEMLHNIIEEEDDRDEYYQNSNRFPRFPDEDYAYENYRDLEN